jgi:hypothetical protein
MEDVTRVHDQVDGVARRRVERALHVGLEVVPPPPSLHPRPRRQVETDVRIAEEKDAGHLNKRTVWR